MTWPTAPNASRRHWRRCASPDNAGRAGLPNLPQLFLGRGAGRWRHSMPAAHAPRSAGFRQGRDNAPVHRTGPARVVIHRTSHGA